MKRTAVFCLLLPILFGCASRKHSAHFPSRYDAVRKQTAYTRMNFPFTNEHLEGKSKQEIRTMFGEPQRIVPAREKTESAEQWLYYPQATNNFIAIIITFENERVKECAYETVM